MLKIVVCDDDRFTLELISGLLDKAISISKVEARIVCLASTGRELLNYIQNTPDSHLYFLDFDLGKSELNGIDLVRKIYQADPQGKVVFVTRHGDKGMEILRSGIRAFGFIEKRPEQKQMVAEYVRYLVMAEPVADKSTGALGVAQEVGPWIELPIGIDEAVTLQVPDISFVDSVKTVAHSICYHTFDESEVTVRDTIEHAQELLGEDFIRCHRSVLVNKNHVLSYKNGLLQLSNGAAVSCALGKKKAVMAACFSGRKTYD